MRFMVIVRATEDSEAGVKPSEKLLTDMGAPDPCHLAGHITRFSLQGQHATVVALLETAALPPPTQGW